MTARWRLDLAFDGSDFSGWQRQSRGRTVQGELSRVLAKLGERVACPIGAGRTDAGVHALAFPVHVDLARPWLPDELTRALRAHLPPDLHLCRAEAALPRFHARHDARGRTYLYALALSDNPFFRSRRWVVPVLPPAWWVEGELKILRGSENFSALARAGAPSDARCRIQDAGWRPLSEGAVFHVTADRFIYGMMRALTGTLVQGFRNGAAAGHLGRVLAGEQRAASAPPQGLYFAGARYAREAPRELPIQDVRRAAGLEER
jgi:tRNA pseudouridine38-40 synthase